jgi:tetratricopeptide (TPR) repeat protein
MSLDPEVARELAHADRRTAARQMASAGLTSPDGLEEVLDAAELLMRDDPAIGTRLAELVRDTAAVSGAPKAAPRASYLLAQAKAAAGQMAEALVLIDAARAGFDTLGLTVESLRTSLGRTQVLNEMGHHAEALEAASEVLDRADELLEANEPTHVELVAASHQNSGLCLELTGRYDEALAHYAAAQASYESIDATRAVAEVRYDRALVLLTLGQHADAMNELRKAASVFRAGGYRALLVMALTHTAEVHLHLGEYQHCLDALAEGREALEGITSPVGEHAGITISARAYLALNLLPEALAEFRTAVGFLERSDLTIDLARVRWGLGLALARTGDHREALESLQLAIGQFELSGHQSWLAEVLIDVAVVLRSIGDTSGAQAAATRAVGAAPDGTPARLRANLLLAELSDAPDSVELLAAVADEAQARSLIPIVAAARHALGRRLVRLGRLGEAEAALRAAVRSVEELRGGLAHELVLTRFLDDKLSPYADLVSLLLARHRPAAEALEIGELARSRTLSDVVSGLAERRVGRHSGADPFDADLRAVYGELFSGQVVPDSDRGRRLQERLSDLESRRELAELRQVHPPAGRAGAGRQPVRATAGAENAPASAAVPTCVNFLRAGDLLHGFVIDGDRVDVVEGIASMQDVSEIADRLRRQWERFRFGEGVIERHLPQLERATRAVLAELHELLWAPVVGLLPTGRSDRICVVADGALHDLPFHALFDGEAYLRDSHVFTYSPSVTTLRQLPARRAGRSVVVGVADELAPLMEHEAESVAARVSDPKLFVGDRARWATIEAALEHAAHVHIAGHALFRPDNPMYSALKVHDRWVTAADLYGLDLDRSLVVLSACDTARSQRSASAEINGFVRGFLGAGASTVVASQWTADDRATTRFMEVFYEQLADRPPAEALRSAQQAVAEDWPHPYFWAPWVVVGRSERVSRGEPTL